MASITAMADYADSSFEELRHALYEERKSFLHESQRERVHPFPTLFHICFNCFIFFLSLLEPDARIAYDIQCPNMTLLSMKKTHLSDATLERLLQDNPRLTTLNISHVTGTTSPSLRGALRLETFIALDANCEHISIDGK